MLYFFSEMEDLVKRILQVDPSKRLSLKQISEHRWMKRVRFIGQFTMISTTMAVNVSISALGTSTRLEIQHRSDMFYFYKIF